MHAIRYEAYSELLREAYGRLDRGSRRRTGAPLAEIARSPPGKSPLARPVLRDLQRLGHRLEGAHDYAIRLDAGSWIRYDFWRTVSESRRRLRQRTDALFAEVERALPLLGGIA